MPTFAVQTTNNQVLPEVHVAGDPAVQNVQEEGSRWTALLDTGAQDRESEEPTTSEGAEIESCSVHASVNRLVRGSLTLTTMGSV